MSTTSCWHEATSAASRRAVCIVDTNHPAETCCCWSIYEDFFPRRALGSCVDAVPPAGLEPATSRLEVPSVRPDGSDPVSFRAAQWCREAGLPGSVGALPDPMRSKALATVPRARTAAANEGRKKERPRAGAETPRRPRSTSTPPGR